MGRHQAGHRRIDCSPDRQGAECDRANVSQLSFLRKTDAAVESLRFHYIARQGFLHGQCFYRGIPESYDDRVIAAIRETADYISNAEALAGILDRG